MDMAFFTRLWYSFNTLGSALEGRTFSDVYNVPKVHGSQNHLHFELPKAKLLSMKLIHDSSRFTLKICHLRSKNKFVYSNVSNHIFFTSRTTLDTQISQVKSNLLQRFHTLSYTSSQIFSTSKEVLRHWIHSNASIILQICFPRLKSIKTIKYVSLELQMISLFLKLTFVHSNDQVWSFQTPNEFFCHQTLWFHSNALR